VLQRAVRRLTLAAALVIAVLLAGFAGYRYGPPALRALLPAPPGGVAAPHNLELAFYEPPRPLPAVRFADAEGREQSLSDFRGRVVLLDIWATWCAPCRKEMPALDRLEGKLGGADFVVLPVSIDRGGMAAVRPFYRSLRIGNLGAYVDPLGRGTSGLDAPGLPATFLIDREGRLAARKLGGARWDDRRMIALIRNYLPPASASVGR
jgi:thiol-disulfide isomerase/thioredoxin